MLFDSYLGIVFLLMCAYFIGSLPTASFVVNLVTDSDKRKEGTKIAGAYNVKRIVGLIPSICVFSLDLIIKGFLPTFAVSYWISDETILRLTFSLLLVVGHNWSIFLKFWGGRGIATALGTLLGLHLWQETVILVVLFGLVGQNMIHKDSALWAFLGTIWLPGLLLVFQRGLDFILFGICLVLILFLKRLFANEKIIDIRYRDWRVMLFRIVWDRDIMSREEWLKKSRY